MPLRHGWPATTARTRHPLGQHHPRIARGHSFGILSAGRLRETAGRPDSSNVCIATGSHAHRMPRDDYGIPFRVGRREPLEVSMHNSNSYASPSRRRRTRSRNWKQGRHQVARVAGATASNRGDADGDRPHRRKRDRGLCGSELSMVLCNSYELYRWQPNLLRSMDLTPSGL